MNPWPCAVFVTVLIAVAWAPIPVNVTVHSAIAWVVAALAFGVADSLNDRSPR